MSEWLPVVAGYGAIAALLALIAIFPNSWWAQELRKAYEVQRTGPLGRFTARDQLRSAGVSILLAVLLVSLSVGAYEISFRFQNGSQRGMVGEVYGFTLFILAAIAVASSVQSSWRALRWSQAERREQDAMRRFPRLYASVRDIVERHDPAGVKEFGQPQEYDLQARRILGYLQRARSYQELLHATQYQFAIWFEDRAGPASAFAPMCHEVWEAWIASRRGT